MLKTISVLNSIVLVRSTFLALTLSSFALSPLAQANPSLSAALEQTELMQYAQELQRSLSDAIVNEGTAESLRILRRATEPDERIGLVEINNFVLASNNGLPITLRVAERQTAIDYANRYMKEAGFSAFVYEQDDHARLIERFREMTEGYGARFSEENLRELRSLSEKVFPGELSPGEIRLGVLDDEILKATTKIEESAKSFHFVRDPALVAESMMAYLPRSDKVRPAHLRRFKIWDRSRKWISPGVAFAAGVIGGWASDSPATGLAVGTVGAGLEWQFAHFSAFWNDRVWSRWGFRSLVGANIAYPLLLKIAEVTTAAVFGGAAVMMSPYYLGKFVVDVTVNTVTFVSSVGGAQVALARLKQMGVMSEFPRYRPETKMVLSGNFGRVLAVASDLMTQSEGVQREGMAMVMEPLGVNRWPVGKWIGVGLQMSILMGYSGPLWFKIKKGDSVYASYTEYLAAVQARAHGRIPNLGAHHYEKRPLKRSCVQALSAFTDFFTP